MLPIDDSKSFLLESQQLQFRQQTIQTHAWYGVVETFLVKIFRIDKYSNLEYCNFWFSSESCLLLRKLLARISSVAADGSWWEGTVATSGAYIDCHYHFERFWTKALCQKETFCRESSTAWDITTGSPDVNRGMQSEQLRDQTTSRYELKVCGAAQ